MYNDDKSSAYWHIEIPSCGFSDAAHRKPLFPILIHVIVPYHNYRNKERATTNQLATRDGVMPTCFQLKQSFYMLKNYLRDFHFVWLPSK